MPIIFLKTDVTIIYHYFVDVNKKCKPVITRTILQLNWNLIGQVQNDRQIYKGVVCLCMRGVDMTEVLAWWKGLAKELQLDIETLDERQEEVNRF